MTSHPQPTKPTGVKLEPAIKQRLKKLGAAKQRSVHWLMKTAIEHYLNEEEKNERLKQETMARWQEANEGKVVNDKEVTAWLKTWGTNEEQDPPT